MRSKANVALRARLVLGCALIVAGAALQGCSTYSVARYSVSVGNVEALKVTARPPAKLSVGEFTAEQEADKTEIGCRAVGPIKTPNGETFAAYVQQALVDELKVAGAYAADAPLQINGRLTHIDFSSTSGANWQLALAVTMGKDAAFKIERAYTYESSFIGEKACALTSQAFMPAVQDLINALAKDPRFAKAVAPGQI